MYIQHRKGEDGMRRTGGHYRANGAIGKESCDTHQPKGRS